ncbi:hypothetical protein AAG570_006966 [Ranatra chinensis]|uniref:Uncharacterized protein n=1 Tax=Ranatra chinensis TaxID=642074 RepID=A0ABD0YVK8_9HEMI
MQFNSSVVRQLKNQIRDMEKAVDVRIKELETLHITNSSNSLSSPSEEISIREQLESLRSKTPEHCPSPVALPIEEITRLQEKLQRYGRAEEVVTRQLRDQHIRFGKLNCRLEVIFQIAHVIYNFIFFVCYNFLNADYLRKHKPRGMHFNSRVKNL